MTGKIKVTTTYRGKATREQIIALGEYAVNDPALFGLASFLVETGRAIWIEMPDRLPRQTQPADAEEIPRKTLPDVPRKGKKASDT